MGASVTLETVSPAVEGSSDNRHTGSGASVGKSQSETLSQSEKSLGEKNRDSRENLLSDTHGSKGVTPDRSCSLATTVSMDLRIDKSPVPSLSSVKQALVASLPGTNTSRPGTGHQSTRDQLFTRSLDIRSPSIPVKWVL